MADVSDLTPKQAAFVREYLVDLNATQAAIRAGYSEKTARQQGERLLSKADIAAAVQAAMNKRAARVEVKCDDILRELMRIAMVDVSKAFDASGNLLPLHEIPEDVRRAIAGIEIQERAMGEDDDGLVLRTKKVKFWDKPKALELLGKHLKLFIDRVEHTGKDGGPIEMEEISPMEKARRIAFLLNTAEQPTQH